MKRGKAEGPNEILIDASSVLSRAGSEWLAVFRKIMETERLSDEWRNNILIPIHVFKMERSRTGNYCGIKLTAHALKLWERIVSSRFRERVMLSQ